MGIVMLQDGTAATLTPYAPMQRLKMQKNHLLFRARASGVDEAPPSAAHPLVPGQILPALHLEKTGIEQ